MVNLQKNINDCNANKRNHKVLITDEAIEKVPLVHYKEIPKEEYENLQNIAKIVRFSKNSRVFLKKLLLSGNTL